MRRDLGINAVVEIARTLACVLMAAIISSRTREISSAAGVSGLAREAIYEQDEFCVIPTL